MKTTMEVEHGEARLINEWRKLKFNESVIVKLRTDSFEVL